MREISDIAKIIKDASLHEIKENNIVYLKNGALHDLAISEISRIFYKGEEIAFDEAGKPVYLSKAMPELVKPQQSQNNEPVKKEELLVLSDNFNNSNYLLFSPLGLFETDPVLMAGFDFPVNENTSCTIHAGYCFNNTTGLSLQSYGKSINYGYKIKTEFKFYRPSKKNPNMRKYSGVGFGVKFVDYERNQWVTDSTGVDFNEEKTVCNAYVIFGQQFVSSANWVFDFYLGFGFRYRYMQEQELNSDYYLTGNFNPENNNTSLFTPDFKCGVLVGFGW